MREQSLVESPDLLAELEHSGKVPNIAWDRVSAVPVSLT